MSNFGPLFEFWEPDGTKRWITTPGKQTTFPLSIRNETAEGHDVVVLVEEPANWAWADPQRVSLNPGDSATVSIVFAPHKESMVAAGIHQASIRLRDFEGVIFAECIRQFEVEERQELAMTMALRGPLMSFGQAEGIVLHCKLANRGNVDVNVTLVGDSHPTLTFSKRTVSVPFQGEVGFDVEVRWNAALRSNHPDVVTLRAPYRDGESSASIEWRHIAEALEPFMPIYSTAEEEDELLSLSWLPKPDKDVLDHRLPDLVSEATGVAEGAEQSAAPDVVPVSGGTAAAASQTPVSPTEPQRLLLQPHAARARSAANHATARRFNPWWPVVQRIGDKWRMKPLPILMLIIAIEGFIIGMTQAQRDYYASPLLRSRIPVISRVLPHVTATVYGSLKRPHNVTPTGGQRLAHSIRFRQPAPRSAPGGVPALWGLAARYIDPYRLSVSFKETHCTGVQLLVASGSKTIYKKSVSKRHATVPIPRGLSKPLRITVFGEAPGGIELRQHIFLALPLAH